MNCYSTASSWNFRECLLSIIGQVTYFNVSQNLVEYNTNKHLQLVKSASSYGNKMYITKTDALALAKLQYIKIVTLE